MLHTPVQHGWGVPAPQPLPCVMQEPGTRQAPSIQVPVQQLRLTQLSPMLAHWAGLQTPSPHSLEQHCESVVQVWVSAKQHPLKPLHSRL
jgi:hypothetical protein